MVKDITIQFEGTPYFLNENLTGVFVAIKSAKCSSDDDEKQGWLPSLHRDIGQLIVGTSLEEIHTNNISLLVKVPARGFIVLEIIEQCRNFARIAKEEYVSVQECYTERGGVVYKNSGRVIGTDIDGKFLYEVKPRLFRRI